MDAQAADIPTVPTPPPPPPPAPSFDLSGPYVGAYASWLAGWLAGWLIGSPFVSVGVNVGYNFQFNSIVVGAEAALGTVINWPPLHVSLRGRAGFVLGERFFLFGLASWCNFGPIEFGGGGEYALTDNISLRADVSVYCCFPPIIVRGGVTYNF